VLLVLALWWWNPVLDRYQGATAVGERRVVELADGSRVTLNTNTRFAATMRLRSRETVLEQGEALFEVAPSAWRPFHTLAGEANIRVVGTIYDVRVDAGGTRVSVVEGRVEVWTPGRQTPFDLAAGTALDTAGAQVARVPAADLKALTAWRDGKLVFDERPIAEVLAEAGRYRLAPIRLADAAAGQPRISGVFSTDNVDALLRMLPEVAAVEVSFGADGEAVVASRRVAADGSFTAPVPIDPKIR
jgi:transmembrane sensor